MKAILVINVPDDFLADPSDAYRLQIGGDAKVYYVRQGEKRASIIGDTRDIKPLPQKLKLRIQREWITDYDRYEIGYNACIDKIMGETE